ncbi:LAQU0S14e02366g1_1 [Lachancea quebecensis]|uniref:LAQU0S14e02366g1_1 n=1 Tax=Lachancea quebecensis TaxID=1654605 RepID=A0A0P1KXU3_9SACH|nr:LAQU0S14e02366g1_1 [Lachancea quebecensis]
MHRCVQVLGALVVHVYVPVYLHICIRCFEINRRYRFFSAIITITRTRAYASASISDVHSQAGPRAASADVVYDSQDSGSGSPIARNQFRYDAEDLSDSDLSNEQSDEDGTGISAMLQLEVPMPAQTPVPSTFESIQFREFDVRCNGFDEQLLSRTAKLRELSKELEPRPATAASSGSDAELSLRKQVARSLQQKVPRAYLDMILTENSSHKFQDWHFMTENAQAMETDPWAAFLSAKKPRKQSLKGLLKSFGVPSQHLSPQLRLITIDMYDTANLLQPVHVMCMQLQRYYKCREFAQSFICFILDRSVFNSPECTSAWCEGVYRRLDAEQFTKTYCQLVASDNYLLHLRVSRQIPRFHEVLLEKLFPLGTCETLLCEFDRLLEAKEHQKLLYFTLFIYGTAPMPFGDTAASRRLRDRVYGVGNDGNYVELVIIRSYINFFIKIV